MTSFTLNPSQEKAVHFDRGSMLVIAGAGTGKTRIITERVKYLIQERNVDPQNILALTFTEKAAGEMLARLDEAMPIGYEEPWVCTFHAFADRLLKLEGHEIGLDTRYKVLTKSYEWLLFRKHLFTFTIKYYLPLGNPTKFIRDILTFIGRLQDELILPKDLETFSKTFAPANLDSKALELEITKWQELAYLYDAFTKVKLKESSLSFADLIYYAYTLFDQRPNILAKYKQKFTHILVDEFQDTNYSQYQLVKLLYPSSEDSMRSLLVVGDDSQSIYKFRGAAVTNILGFMSEYSTAQTVTLNDNYRSQQAILDASYKVVQNNNPETLESKLGISKKLISAGTSKKDIKPKAVCLQKSDDEVEYVVKEILNLLATEEDYTYKDIAIVARSNAVLDSFVFGLRKYGIPYQLFGNRGLYETDEVKNIITLLRFICDPFNEDLVLRTLSIQSFGFSLDTITTLFSTAKKTRSAVWDILEADTSPVSEKFCQLIKKYQSWILKFSPSEFTYAVLSDIGYVSLFLTEETIENQLSIKNLDLYLTQIKRFEIDFTSGNGERPTIFDYIKELDFLLESGDNPGQAEIEDIDTISLLTVHAAKGLEFEAVFMVNLVSGKFPSANRTDSIQVPPELLKEEVPEADSHIAEERRLFYVGMTRAKNYLYLTYALDYGGKRARVPSGFIKETGIVTDVILPNDASSQPSQIGLFGLESGFKSPQIHKLNKLRLPPHFSYSQIETFNTCGLKYKYSYVLNIPTAPSNVLSFGQSIHNTLRDFHTRLMFNEKPSLPELLSLYEDNWIPAGYMDKTHLQLRFEEGKELLEKYYAKNAAKNTKHMAIEKGFSVLIDGSKYRGKIDRIDELADGVEIIDYKTGSSKHSDEDFDDQLNFYAYAATTALNLRPVKLTYYFLESEEIRSFTADPNLFSKTTSKIAASAEKIKNAEFAATPGMHCNWCSYKDICPFAYKG